jgi:hypothetical protein
LQPLGGLACDTAVRYSSGGHKKWGEIPNAWQAPGGGGVPGCLVCTAAEQRCGWKVGGQGQG